MSWCQDDFPYQWNSFKADLLGLGALLNFISTNSILSLNPSHSEYWAYILSFTSASASALPILLLCPHPLQLWQVMVPGGWRIPASKTCRPLLRPAISFHHLTRREWKQNQAESKGRTELKSLILSFFKHKSLWPRTPFSEDQPENKTFQSLLPKNILPHATPSSVLTVVMRTNISQYMKCFLN